MPRKSIPRRAPQAPSHVKRAPEHRARPAIERRAAAAKGRAKPASRAGTTPSRLPRDPKGVRAQFYPDPAIDQLWAVVTALAGEVSVAFERLDTVERLLERDGRVTRAAVEAYRPDPEAAAERALKRDELIVRVFQVLSQYGGGR